jgi:transcriptional regulator with XRE-family HTH domain
MRPSPAGRVIGEVVKELRSQAKISQEKLAELADLHRTYISFIELGLVTPSIAVVFRLADALAIKVGDLVTMARARLT